MTAVSDETGRDWLPLKYEDGPDFCTVTFATGAAFALTVHPERMKLMEAALSAPVGEPWKPGEILGIAQSADRDLVRWSALRSMRVGWHRVVRLGMSDWLEG